MSNTSNDTAPVWTRDADHAPQYTRYAGKYDSLGRRCSSEIREVIIDAQAIRDMHAADTGKRNQPPTDWVLATDHATGDLIEIAVAPCGLGCRCAMGWRRA